MIKVGIDTLAIYTSRYALDLNVLAEARQIDPNKFAIGLGQMTMSVPPPGEDIVTMAANAATTALQQINKDEIDILLFATESGIDHSKAAGIYVHELIGLKTNCRVVELKQACYSATAALQLALPYLQVNPKRKILLIASDIARYGLKTPGESSQGCGAVAMVLSANPRLLAFNPEYGAATENVMDFWRPTYLHEALVEGKYSSKLYLAMLEKCWQEYSRVSGRSMKAHDYFCYHTPVPRLVEKAHKYLLKLNGVNLTEAEILEKINTTLTYGRAIGNSYSASLYIGLASLLDLSKENLGNKRVGFYSYGSGCVAEFFSGVIQPEYQRALNSSFHENLLTNRTFLTYDEYENLYRYEYREDGGAQEIPFYDTGLYRLARINEHKRIYEKVSESVLEDFTRLPLAQGMS